jgi:hypothetical protein
MEDSHAASTLAQGGRSGVPSARDTGRGLPGRPGATLGLARVLSKYVAYIRCQGWRPTRRFHKGIASRGVAPRALSEA